LLCIGGHHSTRGRRNFRHIAAAPFVSFSHRFVTSSSVSSPSADRNTGARGNPTPATITIADEGKRLRVWTRVLFASIWLVPGTIAGFALWYSARGAPGAISLGAALAWQVSCWMVWAIWSQAILTLVDRVPLRDGRVRVWLATHLLASGVVMVASAFVIGWLDWRFTPWRGVMPQYADVFVRTAVRHLDFQFMMYWAILGAAYMVEFVRRYRERDRVATELQERLSLQQLEALRMQLNPHFLFNALNSVTELMEMDVRQAQRALSSVSDLLRLSLRTAASPTIPLWREIELVELYLQVARVRYGDGLHVDIDVDPAAVDLEVPSFVLQPLVENALKHGIWPGRTGQSVQVSARRLGPMLELRVEDNGRGLDGRITDSGRFLAATPNVDGLGIGLTNTRTRLAMLYGDRYAFRMTNSTGGGCTVEIRLPVHG
jgi:signal transduction histidine kinase